MKILIIEDEKIAADRLKRLLIEINEGVEVMAVCQGIEDSLAFLEENHPDVIICDIQLNDGDIFSLTPSYAKKIIWIFTSASSKHVERVIQSNAFDFLLKPIKINELKESIIRTKSYLNRATIPTLDIQNHQFSIGFRFGSRYNFIHANRINYFYAKDKLIIDINRNLKTYPLRISLKTLFDHLEDKLFVLAKNELVKELDNIRKKLNLKREQVKIVVHPELDSDLVNKRIELNQLNKKFNELDNLNIAS